MKFENFLRICELRSRTISLTLTGLSILMFLARVWRQSDLTVTAQLASLAMMIAVCVPFTYLPFLELKAHIQLQRFGRLRKATVVDHRVNPSGFARWRLEIEVPEGIVRKWTHSSAKLLVESTVDVTLTDDWVHCRVETPGKSAWRTTIYLTTLIFVSMADTIESLYCVLFGMIEAVHLLREEGCSCLNIVLHVIFAVVFGGAVLSNLYSCFWKRRYVGLPSIYGYEFITKTEIRKGCDECNSLVTFTQHI